MAHADFILSITDVDLVAGMMRSLLALHQADGDGDCLDCRETSPCATVRIIASTQDAAVARVADPRDEAWEKFMKRPPAPQKVTPLSHFFPEREAEAITYREPAPGMPLVEGYGKTHHFKYPECPEFSGGICPIHHGQAVAGVA